jgi:hypothetical protein
MSKAKTRKIAIFYMSKRDGKDRQPISIGPVTYPPTVVYIRAVLAKATNEDDAMDEVKMRRGETVMNTHCVD